MSDSKPIEPKQSDMLSDAAVHVLRKMLMELEPEGIPVAAYIDDHLANLIMSWRKLKMERRHYPARYPLRTGHEHLTVHGTFQSDKYPWCAAGFVPLKTSDPMAADLLRIYAERRRKIDAAFADDLLEALKEKSD